MPKSVTTAWPAVSITFSGLHIAMDHPVLMGVLQGAADFVGDAERGVEGELAFARQVLAERLPLRIRHDVVQKGDRPFVPPSGTGDDLAGVEQRKDVRVLQAGDDLNLPEEPLAADGGRQLGLEYLERDAPVVLEVLGQQHDRHAAPAELTLDAVAVSQGDRELV